MDKLREFLLTRTKDADEVMENAETIGALLDLANVPDKFISRVLVAYIVVVTGTEEEVEALFVANHMKDD